MDVVREAVIAGSSRQLTALAPVLVRVIDRIDLTRLRTDLARVGLDRRLAWLIDSTKEAIQIDLAASPPRSWAQSYRRALLALDFFESTIEPRSTPVDLLEPHVRSKATLAETLANASPSARRWGIATSLRTDDFVAALRAARGA